MPRSRRCGVKMRPVAVTELQSLSASAWEALVEEEDVVVTSSGRVIAILSAATASTLEETLADRRQAQALLAVARMQREARDTGLDRWNLEEVNAEIDALRRSRR